MIYLDHAATTPISDKALEVYLNVAKHYFGNASSMHDEGSSAKQILEASTKTVAVTLNARPKDVYFTSGASESNFLAIYSLLKAREGKHLITTAIEHSSVRNIFLKLKQEGYEVSTASVDQFGRVDMDELKSLVRDDTALASIQHVNSEIGTIQDLETIGAFLHSKNILLHSDCVQSYGRIPLDVNTMNVDAISISGHKIYGPKGVGAVWMNPKVNWKPVFPDSDHQSKFKPGTSDVPSIAAFATAAKQITQNAPKEQERIGSFRKKIITELKALSFQVEVIEHPEFTVPNILGLRFPGMEGQFLMLECNQAGLAISTGSACQVGSEKPNKTMTAIGKNEQEAREFVRLSFGKENSEDQISQIIQKMNVILNRHSQKVNHHKSKEGS
ncbi:IscS subfamily cysteine desulfurase [Gracilimonas tropica]|uniref:IscS subfamily cysteine desulfurase n=1 Tax=Gracilimonas tropica TaxID=454600 RepID=UPI00037C1304|nr:IscS subfamily cysteine desulfurase [Gracilimonas tropica]